MWSRLVSSLLFTALFVSVDAKPKSSYSDAFSRKYFPTIFAATEAKNASSCLAQVFDNFEMKKHVKVACDETEGVDKCSGITFASHTDRAIVIAFRGTTGVLQLLVESDEIAFRNKTPWVGGGNAGFYFANGFTLIWNNGMKDDFLKLTRKYTDYELWIGGHSLGGSMAALASSYIVANKLFDASRIKLITFGEPRTGDKAFADAHDAMIPYSYRIIHKKDIVPHVPYNGMEGFRHHKSEIWYNNDMSTASYKECDQQESLLCSDSHLDPLVEDHHRYFGMYMSFYGRRDCTGDPAN